MTSLADKLIFVLFVFYYINGNLKSDFFIKKNSIFWI